jgi:hypothetical protein
MRVIVVAWTKVRVKGAMKGIRSWTYFEDQIDVLTDLMRSLEKGKASRMMPGFWLKLSFSEIGK